MNHERREISSQPEDLFSFALHINEDSPVETVLFPQSAFACQQVKCNFGVPRCEQKTLNQVFLSVSAAVAMRGRYQYRVAFRIFLLLVLYTYSASARPTLLNYGLDHRDVLLPRDQDDVASSPFRLRVPVTFYGQQYNSIYVSDQCLFLK